MKTHIPLGDGESVLCGTDSFAAMVTTDQQLCARCMARVHKILAALTDEQLAKLGLSRATANAPLDLSNVGTEGDHS